MRNIIGVGLVIIGALMLFIPVAILLWGLFIMMVVDLYKDMGNGMWWGMSMLAGIVIFCIGATIAE